MSVEAPSQARRYATDLCNELGREFPPETDRATLGLAGGTVLELTVQDETSLLLVSPLAQPQQPVPDGTWVRLLEANFLWRGSRGAVFGFDAGTPLLLQRVDAAHTSYDQFRLLAEDFLNTAATWLSVCTIPTERPADAGLMMEPDKASPRSRFYTEHPDSFTS
jgi:hypothetical protein